jgi:hypothetical protein
VSAVVEIQAAQDGRSIIFTCLIENHSGAPIPQILFPDLWGLTPFAGADQTQLRFADGVVRPFQKPVKAPNSTPFYAPSAWTEYRPGGYMFADNSLRWLDLGSLGGGLSVFQKEWGTADRPAVLAYRSEKDPMSLRLAWEHKRTIQPGETWESTEFWFTPHPGGWAKGIEVFRRYVQQVNPPRELPRHVRDGLGFRSVWMTQDPEWDPAKAYFRFQDVPRLAEEARQYGLDELVPWFWCSYFRLPIPLRTDLGTTQDFLEGVRKAQELGVNVAPFVSLHIILNPYVERYGVKPGHEDWTYHPDLIPRFRPYYTHGLEGAWINDQNQVWQEDVLAALKEWIDRGIESFCWDQFMYSFAKGKEPALISMAEKVRSWARAKNPQSTFSGEAGADLELDSPVLDYTWVWGGCGEGIVSAEPLVNVLRSPRFNCNVEESPLVVKQGFADNLYLNVMPRAADQPNATAWITENPALGTALQQVAKLRKQFLPFFVDGTFIGDSVLKEPTSAFVRGYQLGNELLVILLNDQPETQSAVVKSALKLWLPRATSYDVKYFDSAGALVETKKAESADWQGVTRQLAPQELAFFVIQSHRAAEPQPKP